jgi:Holliday junction resolvase RusA-like endonuclease
MRLTYAQAKALGIKIPGQQQKKKPQKIETLATWDAEVMDGVTKIVMPSIPPSLNVWKNWHWSKQKTYKDQMYANFAWLKLAFKLPTYEKCHVTVTFYFPVKRRRDLHDNYSIKFIGDSLVKAGILFDDNSELITVNLAYDIDKDRSRTEIIIREAE